MLFSNQYNNYVQVSVEGHTHWIEGASCQTFDGGHQRQNTVHYKEWGKYDNKIRCSEIGKNFPCGKSILPDQACVITIFNCDKPDDPRYVYSDEQVPNTSTIDEDIYLNEHRGYFVYLANA
jgi:hypothetical protein